MSAPEPSSEDVYAAVRRLGRPTLAELQTALSVPWRERTTLRNRVYDLVASGQLTEHDGDPARFSAQS